MTSAAARSLAPSFALPDSQGRRVALADLLGRGPVVIVFFRGHWCPYCRRYLGKLQANHAKLLERGVTVAAISPEPPATSATLARDLGLSFPLLCDTCGDAIDRYGARNRFAGTRTILPHPAVFVLDAAGSIHFRSINRNYKKRTTMHAIFRAAEEILSPAAG